MIKTMHEELVLIGYLDMDDEFKIARCYSTRVPQSLSAKPSGYSVLAINESNEVIEEIALQVDEVCVMRGESMRMVTGRIAINPMATAFLVRSPRQTLWHQQVLERPRLEMKCNSSHASRTHALELHLRPSHAYSGAFIQIIYEWGPAASRVIDILKPTDHYRLDLSSLPGGEKCRIWAHYSNGMRSDTAASAPFSLPRLPAIVSILEPKCGRRFQLGQPVEFLGQIVDPQAKDCLPLQGGLEWLMDGTIVGRGPVACVLHAPIGAHEIKLFDKRHDCCDTLSIEILPMESPEKVPADLWED